MERAAVDEMDSNFVCEGAKEGMRLTNRNGARAGRSRPEGSPEQSRHWPKVLEALELRHVTRREAAKRLRIRYQRLQAALAHLEAFA